MKTRNMSILSKVSTLVVLSIISGCAVFKAHSHDHTPHGGVIVPFNAKQVEAGFTELKLHDDKGDLELWITRSIDGAQPFDLPLDAKVKITFPNLDDKEVELHIRNREKNEDEKGRANIRENKTNYFIFPGKTGSDASFLTGKNFSTDVIVSFELNGLLYRSAPFKLYPHTH